MYFDHKIFGLTPSFTSILQRVLWGGGKVGGDNTEHRHLKERNEGNERKSYLENNNAAEILASDI